MAINAILFKFDGMLVGSNHLHASACFDAFTQFGIAIPVEGAHGKIGGFDDRTLSEAGAVAIYDSLPDLLARYDMSPLAAA